MRFTFFLLSVSLLLRSTGLAASDTTRKSRKATPSSNASITPKDRVTSVPVTPSERPPELPTPSATSSTPPVIDQYTALAASLGADQDEEKTTFFHQCQHIRSTTLKRILEDFLTASGRVAASEESDIVVISDTVSNAEELRTIAETVDTRVPQVLVEAQIVELTLDTDFEKEVNLAFDHISASETSFIKQILGTLTTPGANPTTGQGGQYTLRPYVKNYDGGKRNELTVFLRYLETKGKAKILSAPNLILRRGSEGSINTGEQVPILQQTVVSGSLSTSTVFKDVGIKMKVTPVMIAGNTVRLQVNPEVSTVTGFTSAGNTGVSNPIIAVRYARTELEVKDGELISIGGLLRNEERTVRKRVPVAGSIPVLGHMFRSARLETVKTQLVIFLRLRILDEGKPEGVTIYRPTPVPDAVETEVDHMEQEFKEPQGVQILRDFELMKE